MSLIVLDDGRKYIRESGLLIPYDWRWKSAQSGDMWIPKRGRAGKLVSLPHPISGIRRMTCEDVVIDQHHNADHAVIVKNRENGHRMLIRWTDLRKYWKPQTQRPTPS
jgi:hypothetical protein